MALITIKETIAVKTNMGTGAFDQTSEVIQFEPQERTVIGNPAKSAPGDGHATSFQNIADGAVSYLIPNFTELTYIVCKASEPVQFDFTQAGAPVVLTARILVLDVIGPTAGATNKPLSALTITALIDLTEIRMYRADL